MANFRILAPQISSGYLNAEDNASPGKNVGSASLLTSTAGYGGQLGKVFEIDTVEALKLSKTAIGTLFGGGYQMVRTLSTSVQAFARGQAVFWSDRGNFVVTADPPAGVALGGAFAGVVLNAVTRGNYTWIQIYGKANGLYATITETAVVGDPLFVVADTTGKFNNIADATVITPLISGNYVARSLAITSAAIGLIDLDWHNRVV